MDFKEFFKPALGKVALFILIFLMAPSLAFADVPIAPPTPPPGEYKIVDYKGAYVFDGNFDDYAFVCMGSLHDAGMCHPVMVTPSSIGQELPCPQYKLCSNDFYAFPKTEFEKIVKELEIQITTDGYEIEVNPDEEFLQDFVDQNKIAYAIMEHDSNYPMPESNEVSSYYFPRGDPEYKIISEKVVTTTVTIKGVDFQNKKILNDTKREVTKFIDYTNGSETPAPTPTPQNNETPAPTQTPNSQTPTPSQGPAPASNDLPAMAILGMAAVAAIIIVAVFFLKKRK
ncbi:MAG: hypothetical protein NT067_01965 [Candidatus Diapherotrites archaeon]|nr:hypothetical protein [Candidatus Diapherotrites archaeon]